MLLTFRAGKFVADDPGYRRSLPPEYHPDYRVVHLQRLVLGMGGITSEPPSDSLSTLPNRNLII
jgi:hypothetical protein